MGKRMNDGQREACETVLMIEDWVGRKKTRQYSGSNMGVLPEEEQVFLPIETGGIPLAKCIRISWPPSTLTCKIFLRLSRITHSFWEGDTAKNMA